MTIFEQIKEQVQMKDVALAYGFKMTKSGLINCPFHNDRNPSMRVDKRFYCFGCGASGDVIDFVSQYYGLSVMDAANKLIVDFDLHIEAHKSKNVPGRNSCRTFKKPDMESQVKKAFDAWVNQSIQILSEYHLMLIDWKQQYEPKNPEEEWHPLFVEALDKETMVEFILDGLSSKQKETQIEVYETYKKEVERIERRLGECKQGHDTEISDGFCDSRECNGIARRHTKR